MRNASILVVMSAFLVVLLCLPPSSYSDEGDGSAVTTTETKEDRYSESVVVTGSKTERAQDEVTQDIAVIDPADAAVFYPNRNIAEALASEPGVFVSTLSRNDANWGSYGGLGPKYNTYLLDGLPIDGFIDTMNIDPWCLDRIETQYGVASVLYSNYLSMDFAGNQSPLAGTTNLLTRTWITEPELRLSVNGGSYDTFTGRVYAQQQKGPISGFIGASTEYSDYTDYGTDVSWLNMLDDPQYRKNKFYAGAAIHSADESQTVSLFFHHTDHFGDAGRPNRDFTHSYDLVNMKYRGIFTPSLSAQVAIGYRGYDRRWGEDNYNPPQSYDLSLASHNGVLQEIVPLDLSVGFLHLDRSLLTIGGDFQSATYKTYSENDGRTYSNDAEAGSLGFYLQEELLLDRWVLRAGGRLQTTEHRYDLISGTTPEKDTKTWESGLWSAGVRFRATDRISVFSNGGTSFIVPSIKSVGGTLRAEDEGVSGKNGQLPNPDLKPESGLGGDIGVMVELLESLSIDFRGFVNRIDDAIVENRISEDPSQSKSINAGSTDAVGITARISQTIGEHLFWFLSGTFTDSEISNDVDSDQDGAEVPFVPDYSGNLGFTWRCADSLALSMVMHAVGSYYDSSSLSGRKEFGSYQVVNCNVRKSLYRQNGMTADLTVEFNNIFDEKYELPWQFQDPGFNFLAGIELVL